MNSYTSRPIKIVIPFFILLFTSVLTGCIDLAGSGAITNHKINKQQLNSKSRANQAKPLNGEVHTMRGGLGIFSKGMNQLRVRVAEQYHVPASSTMWYNAGHVSKSIINYHNTHKERPIILVGHSLGANEQIKVARNLNKAGIPVALLITVDAVSQTIVPPNVQHAMNFYKPGFVPMFSGLKLRAVNPNATVIENINVGTLQGVRVNHFTIDKDETVQQMILVEVKKVLTNANRKQV